MLRVHVVLPVLALAACTTSQELTAVEASRSLGQADERGIVCTAPVRTERPDGSVASSIVCEQTAG